MKKKGATELLPSAVKTYDALHSIWSALEANPEQLASRLRRGDASKAEMALAADLIEGKKKPRRPRSSREQRLIIAEHVAWLKKLYPTWQRKKIISVAVEWLKRNHRYISERHVYKALAEFDGNAVAKINRMPRNENERTIEPNQRLRNDLKDVNRDLLIEIIEDFLARK
jgi:hypothetical protein